MRYPEFIKKGDRIGYTAPSMGATTEPYASCFAKALEVMAERGYGHEIGKNVYKDDGIGISTNPKAAAEELVELYLSKENQALISTGGGEMMCELLPYVDWEKIKAGKPKWYLGYSDNTNFTFVATTMCDVATVYGPCAPTFGVTPWHPCLEQTMEVLEGRRTQVENFDLWELDDYRDAEHPFAPMNVTEPVVIKSFPEGNHSFTGRLVGGCLDCLVNLRSTDYDHVAEFNEKYKEDGIIWFLEACDLNIFGIRRAIWQLKEIGWFKYLKGFLIGRPVCFGEAFLGLDQYTAVTDLLAEYQVPILMDLDFGHRNPTMPIVTGALAKVDFTDGHFCMTYLEDLHNTKLMRKQWG